MNHEKRIAIYPGSFDPLTNGHVDLIERSLKLFDEVVVAVLHNYKKQGLFSVKERIAMIQDSFPDTSGIQVESFEGLLVDFAKIKGAAAVIRGMRAASDFENEFQMALLNRKLSRDVQSVFLITGQRWIFTSSSSIKEAALFGGDISDMVPIPVLKKLMEKYPKLHKTIETKKINSSQTCPIDL